MTLVIAQLIGSLTEKDYLRSYQIQFVDGRIKELLGKDVIRTTHINWHVNSFSDGYRVMPVVQVAQYLKLKYMKGKMYIDLPEALVGEKKNFRIDPYVMGVLLGDGGLTGRSINITSADLILVDFCRERLPVGFAINKREAKYGYGLVDTRSSGRGSRNEFYQLIENYGINVLSHEKFIPEDYLTADIQQRKDLLRGLMDTDGTIDKRNNTASYCTTSKRLAENVQRLVQELGGIAKISEKQTHFTYKNEYKAGRLAYNINLRVKNSSELFLLPRKLSLTWAKTQYSDVLKLRIESITPK